MSRQNAEAIEEEAARWVIRLDRDGADPALETELQHWLADDMRRRGALLQAEAAWRSLDMVPGIGVPATNRWSLPRRGVLAAGMAGIAAMAAGVLLWPAGGDLYETSVGEIRRVPLGDRSVASINTATRVRATIATDARRITIDRGEAWFQVVPDRTRPFVVTAGDVRVQAVGTAFSVRRHDDGAEVLVTEGVVRAWIDGDERTALTIAAGNGATLGAGLPIRRLADTQAIDRRLAWRAGEIDLAGERLGDAVAEFNRYNRLTLAVADPALANERLYGVFRTDDPDGFARAAAVSLNASLRPDGPDRLILATR